MFQKLRFFRGTEHDLNFTQDEKEVHLGVVDHEKLKVIRANEKELLSHEAYLEKIQTKSSW